VQIEYDAANDAANRRKHGVSLDDAELMDLAPATVVVDDRRPYGEPRFRAFGRIEGRGRCLVFSYRARRSA
jgi:uncharacterized DUF497 family protein